MWLYVGLYLQNRFLQKYKARVVAWGNHQAKNGLPTRATTLASTTFRTLMAITAKFDLETQQTNAINAFVHRDVDEFPPGLEKENKVLRLRKALYESLWAQAVPATLAKGTNKYLQKDGFPRSSSEAMRDAQRRSYCLLR